MESIDERWSGIEKVFMPPMGTCLVLHDEKGEPQFRRVVAVALLGFALYRGVLADDGESWNYHHCGVCNDMHTVADFLKKNLITPDVVVSPKQIRIPFAGRSWWDILP